MREHLQELALKLFHITRLYRIRLNVTWIPRTENKRANYYSRICDYDDWGVCRGGLADISSAWVAPTIDRFADAENTHCPRFISRFYQPGTEAVDAFTQGWRGEVNLLVPPIYLIPCTIPYLELCSAEGILFLPKWESAVFWPSVLKLIRTRSPGQHIQAWTQSCLVIWVIPLAREPTRLAYWIFHIFVCISRLCKWCTEQMLSALPYRNSMHTEMAVIVPFRTWRATYPSRKITQRDPGQ